MIGLGRFPVETIERKDEALFLRPPHDVGDFQHRVLQMRRNDCEVLAVEDDEFKVVHGRRAPLPRN
jgi:hypothetical protein